MNRLRKNRIRINKAVLITLVGLTLFTMGGAFWSAGNFHSRSKKINEKLSLLEQKFKIREDLRKKELDAQTSGNPSDTFTTVAGSSLHFPSNLLKQNTFTIPFGNDNDYPPDFMFVDTGFDLHGPYIMEAGGTIFYSDINHLNADKSNPFVIENNKIYLNAVIKDLFGDTMMVIDHNTIFTNDSYLDTRDSILNFSFGYNKKGVELVDTFGIVAFSFQILGNNRFRFTGYLVGNDKILLLADDRRLLVPKNTSPNEILELSNDLGIVRRFPGHRSRFPQLKPF